MWVSGQRGVHVRETPETSPGASQGNVSPCFQGSVSGTLDTIIKMSDDIGKSRILKSDGDIMLPYFEKGCRNSRAISGAKLADSSISTSVSSELRKKNELALCT